MKDLKGPLEERQIADVYRVLADEYADQRLESDRRRAAARINRGALVVGEPRQVARPFLRRFLPALAAVVGGGLLVTLWARSPGDMLEYTVEGATADHGTVRTQGQPAWVRFSDESTIKAAPTTALQIDIVGEHAALARLMNGNLQVSVHHAENTNWRFLAGPYEVRVVGTKFDLAWDPEGAKLAVVMHEGKVHVLGPGQDRMLVGGQRLDLGRSTLAPEAPSSPAVANTPPQAQRSEPTKVAVAPRNSAAAEPHKANPASWVGLVASGRFEEVVQKAQAEGIPNAHAKRGAEDLRALAQAAAYTGRTDLSIKTWTVVRNRFQGRTAEQAAFFLGRTLEQHGKPSDALHWLRTYLREAPKGVYASEALGEVLTLVRRTEGSAAAQPVARNYLERFPKGSYAAAARAVLDGQ